MLLEKIPEFQRALLRWYQQHARSMPWRETKDPYKIWISEIMLQQTQVATVIPYYRKWIKRFPGVNSLAGTPRSEVLRYWAGLGYYRRAAMLHEAAQKIVTDFGGHLPEDPDALLKLPGIGRYTAGAVASIAFGRRAAVLDGNVIRILTRLTAFKKDTGSPKTIHALWGIAKQLVPEKKPGDFNQAMMELGATVCFPDRPNCGGCPVRSFCKAYALGRQTAFPYKKRKEKIENIKRLAVIFKRHSRVLVQKQPDKARWGGLWMFPHWDSFKRMLDDTGSRRSDFIKRMTVKHGFTKYRVHLDVFESSSDGRKIPQTRWVDIQALEKLALPSPHRKISNFLAENYATAKS